MRFELASIQVKEREGQIMENQPFSELSIAIHNADMHVKLTHCFVSVVNSIHKA